MSGAAVEEDRREQVPIGSITVEFSSKTSGIKTIRIVWDIERLYTHNMTRGDSVSSPTFGSEPLCTSIWRLVFFPKGNSPDSGTTSSIRLENRSKGGNFFVEFTVSVTDAKNKSTRYLLSKASTQFTFSGRDSNECISVGHLYHTRQCQIACEFTKCLDMNDCSPYSESTICTSQKKLSDDLAAFFAKEAFCDVILRVEGKEINAHKNILSARSPVFLNMFFNAMKENRDNIVEISDMSYDSMLKFVTFLYSGKIDGLSFEVAFELLAASHKYMISDLHIVSSEFLSKSLTMQNCLDVLLLADVHSNADLKETAKKFFCDNFKQVCETTDWQNRLYARPHLAVECISMLAKKA